MPAPEPRKRAGRTKWMLLAAGVVCLAGYKLVVSPSQEPVPAQQASTSAPVARQAQSQPQSSSKVAAGTPVATPNPAPPSGTVPKAIASYDPEHLRLLKHPEIVRAIAQGDMKFLYQDLEKYAFYANTIDQGFHRSAPELYNGVELHFMAKISAGAKRGETPRQRVDDAARAAVDYLEDSDITKNPRSDDPLRGAAKMTFDMLRFAGFADDANADAATLIRLREKDPRLANLVSKGIGNFARSEHPDTVAERSPASNDPKDVLEWLFARHFEYEGGKHAGMNEGHWEKGRKGMAVWLQVLGEGPVLAATAKVKLPLREYRWLNEAVPCRDIWGPAPTTDPLRFILQEACFANDRNYAIGLNLCVWQDGRKYDIADASRFMEAVEFYNIRVAKDGEEARIAAARKVRQAPKGWGDDLLEYQKGAYAKSALEWADRCVADPALELPKLASIPTFEARNFKSSASWEKRNMPLKLTGKVIREKIQRKGTRQFMVFYLEGAPQLRVTEDFWKLPERRSGGNESMVGKEIAAYCFMKVADDRILDFYVAEITGE